MVQPGRFLAEIEVAHDQHVIAKAALLTAVGAGRIRNAPAVCRSFFADPATALDTVARRGPRRCRDASASAAGPRRDRAAVLARFPGVIDAAPRIDKPSLVGPTRHESVRLPGAGGTRALRRRFRAHGGLGARDGALTQPAD